MLEGLVSWLLYRFSVVRKSCKKVGKPAQVLVEWVEIKDDGGLIVLETVNALKIRTINVTQFQALFKELHHDHQFEHFLAQYSA